MITTRTPLPSSAEQYEQLNDIQSLKTIYNSVIFSTSVQKYLYVLSWRVYLRIIGRIRRPQNQEIVPGSPFDDSKLLPLCFVCIRGWEIVENFNSIRITRML